MADRGTVNGDSSQSQLFIRQINIRRFYRAENQHIKIQL
jgi:hypothetical protein